MHFIYAENHKHIAVEQFRVCEVCRVEHPYHNGPTEEELREGYSLLLA